MMSAVVVVSTGFRGSLPTLDSPLSPAFSARSTSSSFRRTVPPLSLSSTFRHPSLYIRTRRIPPLLRSFASPYFRAILCTFLARIFFPAAPAIAHLLPPYVLFRVSRARPHVPSSSSSSSLTFAPSSSFVVTSFFSPLRPPPPSYAPFRDTRRNIEPG